jgi:hypothetical protein
MHGSSQWFVAQAISAIRHGIGSPLAFAMADRRNGSWSTRPGAGAIPLRGFAVSVRLAPCLAIEDEVGCAAQVLSGQAWITAEGAAGDTIAEAGTTVPLERGKRFNFSAFRDVTTVLITTPRQLLNVAFSLQKRDGMHVLSIKTGNGSPSMSLSGIPAAITGFVRQFLVATGLAAI